MPSTDRRRFTHHLLRSGILTGFAMMIVFLAQNGSLTLYIAPRMILYVKLSAMGLYLAAIYQVYAAIQAWQGKNAAACDCGHEPSASIPKNLIVYGLFLLPLALGFILPDGMLGSTIAAKKGLQVIGADSHLQVPENNVPAVSTGTGAALTEHQLDSLFPGDEYTAAHAEYGKRLYMKAVIEVPEKWYIETLTTLDLFRTNFIGKTVEISGFVYRDEGMTKNQFAVSRFAMNCCSADSAPYGLIVDTPRAAEYKIDTWVKVRGTLALGPYDGGTVMQLQAGQIQVIEAPKSPYVFPDYDFEGHFQT